MEVTDSSKHTSLLGYAINLLFIGDFKICYVNNLNLSAYTMFGYIQY